MIGHAGRHFLVGAFVKAALRPARRYRVQLSWIKVVAEKTLERALHTHVWLPETEVRAALEASGYLVRADGLVRCSFINPRDTERAP